VERRSGVLRSAGQDAPPRESLLAAVASGWGVESEEEARRRRRLCLLLRGHRRHCSPPPLLAAAPQCTRPSPPEPLLSPSNLPQAQRQLLSFSASATLSPSARAQALGMRSGAERLAAATAVLKEQQRRLSALLVLRDAGLEAS